ncbi:hypothetical protein BDAP_000141 [Binucleata daphniae]
MHTNLLLARRIQIIGLGKEILEYFVNINNTHLTITLCMSPKHRQCFYKLIYYLNIADEERNIIRKINVQNKYKITLPTENTYSSDYLSLTYIKTIITILSDEFQDYPYKSKYMDVINAYYEDLNKILLHTNITNKIALTTHITPFTAKSVTDEEYIEICKIFSNQ